MEKELEVHQEGRLPSGCLAEIDLNGEELVVHSKGPLSGVIVCGGTF